MENDAQGKALAAVQTGDAMAHGARK